MRFEDLGIDRKMGTHCKRLTPAESRFVGILWTDHQGLTNKISADDLAAEFCGIPEDERDLHKMKREVRYMHNHLLTKHSQIPILSKAGNDGGYWVAESEAEANEFYNSFRQRGLTGLVKASRGKQAAMVDMVEQISFEFDELVDRSGLQFPVTPRAGEPLAIEVVDAFLERMSKDPEKFADGLRKIGQKYGSVLLPKDAVEAMRAKAAELQEMVNRLAA